MLFKIAWRNIWRSRTRSLVVIGAIIVGVWAVIFLISFSSGMVTSYINNNIQNELSHIQIHNPDFLKENDPEYQVKNPQAILSEIRSKTGVKAVTARSVTSGMLSSSKGARGVKIKGVNPQTEREVTNIEKNLIEGEYLEEETRNPILISREMADKLHVKLRSKLVLTFPGLNGEITAGAFRISGLFDTGSNAFDELNVLIRQDDLNRLLGDSSATHEIAIFLDEPDSLQSIATAIQTSHPDLKVRTYKEISPEIELFESQIQVSATIFTVIVMLALIFGIINTMLMAVLERYKELGMLMAIGMNKLKVFLMIMFETCLLGLISAPLGLLIGWLTVTWLNKTGISLAWYSEGMEEFGMSDMVYPDVYDALYLQIALAVAITALLASIYPAIKAIRLKPVDAIRKI